MNQLTVSTYNKDPFTDGIVYYKPISFNECEIIPHPNGTPYNIPNTSSLNKEIVTNAQGDNFTIVGIAKFAFKNAQFPSNGNTSMPQNIRYVADSAFQSVKSGGSETRGSIRLYGDKLEYISSTAFIGNRIRGSILTSNGDPERFNQVEHSCYNVNSVSGNMFLLAEKGIKIIAFPYQYPLGNSEGWSPANRIVINSAIKEIGAYAMANIISYKTVTMSSVELIDTAAFMNSGVITLNLGSAIASIGPDAFTGATSISTINISAATPPEVASDFEPNVYENATLNLNGNAATNKLAYMAHPIWGKFFKGSTLKATLTNATNGEARKVTDNLTVAMVDATEKVLYLADDNGAAAQSAEDGWIDFVGVHLGMPYTNYSHNNWIAVKVDDTEGFATGMTVENLVGTFNTATTSINAAAVQKGEETVTFTPNLYTVANFGGQVQTTMSENTYFFMQPAVNEVATVTWAEYAGNGFFKVPENASYFAGQLKVDMNGATGMEPSIGTVYTLDGALVPDVPAGTSDMPQRATDLVMKNALVYQDQSIITGLNDLPYSGKVAGIKYYNLAGMASDRPFDGVNIVVTTYTDGTQSTSKVMK